MATGAISSSDGIISIFGNCWKDHLSPPNIKSTVWSADEVHAMQHRPQASVNSRFTLNNRMTSSSDSTKNCPRTATTHRFGVASASAFAARRAPVSVGAAFWPSRRLRKKTVGAQSGHSSRLVGRLTLFHWSLKRIEFSIHLFFRMQS